jgi:hypothetical protein
MFALPCTLKLYLQLNERNLLTTLPCESISREIIMAEVAQLEERQYACIDLGIFA